MSIEAGVYSYITAQSAITSIVGTDIHFSNLPEDATNPALVISLISNVHKHNLTSASGASLARFQFDCISDRMVTSVSLAEAIRQALQGYSGTMGTETVFFCQLDNEQDLSEAPQDGSDNWTYRKVIDYLIHYRETVPA